MDTKEIVNTFCGIFGVIGTVVAVITLDAEKMEIWYYIIIFACILVAAVCGIRLLANVVSSQGTFMRYINYLVSPKSPLVLLEKECTYTFLDRTHMEYAKRFKIQSKVSELHTFDDMYMWTKDYKKQRIEPLNADKITYEYTEDQWQFYIITFDTFYGKNKIHETGIRMPDLEDPKKESQLFLSTGIFEPTVKICLNVVIKGGLRFKQDSAFCYVYNYYYGRAADSQMPVRVDLLPEGEGYKISYSIKYPVKGARYKLVWEFENS